MYSEYRSCHGERLPDIDRSKDMVKYLNNEVTLVITKLDYFAKITCFNRKCPPIKTRSKKSMRCEKYVVLSVK